MLPTLKFLHSMRERAYLEQALTAGLMLRDHEVCLAPATAKADWQQLTAAFMPALAARLNAIGARWETLEEERRITIMRGLGTVRGNIPMLCFTEVPQGRELSFHHLSFGGYGVVVERGWLEESGGDRVLYVGDNSPTSRNLSHILSLLHIAGLFMDGNGQVLFHNSSHSAMLDFLGHVEVRGNVSEFEWRIVGQHGFMGGKRNSGTRIPLPLEAIEAVLVQKDDDISHFEGVLRSLAESQASPRVPKVLCQPMVLGHA